VGLAAVVLAALVAQVAVAGGAGDPGKPRASASVVSTAKFKKLKNQVAALQQQVDALARQPGPAGAQGPQGPAGSAPACQGNAAGDVMVSAGSVCIDRYEASVWTQPNGSTQLTTNAQIDAACPDNGQPSGGADCEDFYARSVVGVEPARNITWFQAQQALANSGKRLPTNAEWQQAVAGTPEGQCNTSDGVVTATGLFSNCVSRFGAFDMVGNIWEWVGDWDEEGFNCTDWPVGFGSDTTCIGRGSGEASTHFPGALIRGGDFAISSAAGPFAVSATIRPSNPLGGIGFRGAR
jgi:formylglycine-generating enzyme required for sulfatase activity